MANPIGRVCIALLFLTLVTSQLPPALAGDAVARIGDAVVRYDDTRWRVSSVKSGLYLEPQGDEIRRSRPVSVRVQTTREPCTKLALSAFPSDHYDTDEATSGPIRIGNVEGVVLAAHTYCRNATAPGVVACVRVGQDAYLLATLEHSCRGRAPFSAASPIMDIAAGMTFGPASR